jgi:hypothetical protein
VNFAGKWALTAIFPTDFPLSGSGHLAGLRRLHEQRRATRKQPGKSGRGRDPGHVRCIPLDGRNERLAGGACPRGVRCGDLGQGRSVDRVVVCDCQPSICRVPCHTDPTPCDVPGKGNAATRLPAQADAAGK